MLVDVTSRTDAELNQWSKLGMLYEHWLIAGCVPYLRGADRPPISWDRLGYSTEVRYYLDLED